MGRSEEILASVRDFADQAHGEQTRKYTAERYIVHPERVMKLCQQVISDPAVLSAALLHDVLEDTSTGEQQIRDCLIPLLGREEAERSLSLVVELTDVFILSNYPRMRRAERKVKEAERMSKVSADAQTIKYADVLDNSQEIVGQDPGFAPVYLKEARTLLRVMRDGHPGLRSRAEAMVEVSLARLQTRAR